jgi:Ras-related protein Rab-8A
VCGNTNTGKTNLLLRYTEGKFIPTRLSSIGIDFKIKTCEVDGIKVKL